MKIAVTGSTGLIGAALTTSLTQHGHRVAALVRGTPKPGTDQIRWDPSAGVLDAASLEGFDGVVHLAGAGVGDKRWSPARKKLIYDSRIDGTDLLARALAGLTNPPRVFVCGSAIGFYGNRGDEVLTETSSRGQGFLADLVVDWEAAAQPSIDAGIRTALARTGIVLTPKGGSLKKQLPLFKLGLGGRFGPGTQWVSWISLRDEVRALSHLLTHDVSGPVNLCGPAPVTNATFTKELGKVLKRPTLLPVPLLGPRLLFGKEFVEEAPLASQRVMPAAIESAGFTFEDIELAPALRHMLGESA